MPVYGSGGFTSYTPEQMERHLTGWMEQGITAVKMKVGAEPDLDPERVRHAREVIGGGGRLCVDANGAYSRKQALALAETFAREAGVSSLEEPVSSDDLEGLRSLRDRSPAGMDIAAGEYGYDLVCSRRMLEAGAVDVLQADVTRCGGITQLLQVGALCAAPGLRLSAHTSPAVHAHVCAAIEPLEHVEYFHDHARIEELLFDNTPPCDDGRCPGPAGAGLGLTLREHEAGATSVDAEHAPRLRAVQGICLPIAVGVFVLVVGTLVVCWCAARGAPSRGGRLPGAAGRGRVCVRAGVRGRVSGLGDVQTRRLRSTARSPIRGCA